MIGVVTPRRRERFVVGYIAGPRGRDAIALASHLARGVDAELVVTMVVPEPSSFAATHGVPAGIDPIVQQQVDEWMREALALVPDDVSAIGDVRVASSEAAGLIEAAVLLGGSLIVIGAQAVALLRQFTIGTVATSLLHASPVPVALAPGGFADEAAPVRRVTAIYGTRPGANEVIGRAVERAVQREVPLRLLSLVQVDRSKPAHDADVTDRVRAYGGERLAEVAETMLDDGTASVEVVEGRGFEDAAAGVDWLDGEIAMLGSSRLGQGGRVFVGNTALRILRTIPVPVIVVPRGIVPESTSRDA